MVAIRMMHTGAHRTNPKSLCKSSSRTTLAVLGLLILACTYAIFHFLATTKEQIPKQTPSSCNTGGEASSCPVEKKPWDSSNFVLGAPREQYQDNLRRDLFYLTSWTNAGFTNQFMNYVNMIYLAIISDRIPILPPFAPDHHISPSAGPLPFSEIFNLEELRQILRQPILEWSEVKALAPRLSLVTPSSVEQIGCWSTRSEDQKVPIRARSLLDHLGLDISYTRVPRHTRHDPTIGADVHVAFSPLAELIYPVQPRYKPGDYPIMYSSPLGADITPDTHMACFDVMYYASAGTEGFEWEYSWSPAWRNVGRHLKFTHNMTELAKGYLRNALGVVADELPPFIAVHVRRGDFASQCPDVSSGCLPPLSYYIRRVKEVQGSFFVKRGIKVTEVLLTSDEKDPEFWGQVAAQGWKYINHTAEQTLERHGEWFLPIIDIVAQSLSSGFVGSIGSTVSLVSARRVEEWNGGVVRVVGWAGQAHPRSTWHFSP